MNWNAWFTLTTVQEYSCFFFIAFLFKHWTLKIQAAAMFSSCVIAVGHITRKWWEVEVDRMEEALPKMHEQYFT